MKSLPKGAWINEEEAGQRLYNGQMFSAQNRQDKLDSGEEGNPDG